MTLTIKLVAVLAFATLSTCVPLTVKSADQSEESPLAFAPEETLSAEQKPLPLSLVLPREDDSPVIFLAPEPATDLRAPEENVAIDYYGIPIPNQDLVAPSETEWNPENDPKFYYEVPAVLTKQELPTEEFPKKYNKDIHEKEKPLVFKPKQEIAFVPISAQQYEDKQRQLEKTFDKLAKKENQKAIKMLPPRNRNHSKTSPADSNHNHKSSDQLQSASFDQGLSSQLIDSLGIPTNAAEHAGSSNGGERLEFHMVGHDGPLSYKWGYDTGKGHNRLFRYEERDKEGVVKGHYGFYDKEGKVQVIHYDAHPQTGFHVHENA